MAEFKVRLIEPEEFLEDSFKRVNDELGTGIDSIYGILKIDAEAGTMTMQALRFRTEQFPTVEDVQKWLDEHEDIKYIKIDTEEVDNTSETESVSEESEAVESSVAVSNLSKEILPNDEWTPKFEAHMLPFGEYDLPLVDGTTLHTVIDLEFATKLMNSFNLQSDIGIDIPIILEHPETNNDAINNAVGLLDAITVKTDGIYGNFRVMDWRTSDKIYEKLLSKVSVGLVLEDTMELNGTVIPSPSLNHVALTLFPVFSWQNPLAMLSKKGPIKYSVMSIITSKNIKKSDVKKEVVTLEKEPVVNTELSNRIKSLVSNNIIPETLSGKIYDEEIVAYLEKLPIVNLSDKVVDRPSTKLSKDDLKEIYADDVERWTKMGISEDAINKTLKQINKERK